MQMMLDAEKLAEKAAAHEYLAGAMKLPEYYGRNLDALYDWLTEQKDLQIEFVNVPDAEEKSYFHILRRVFEDAGVL